MKLKVVCAAFSAFFVSTLLAQTASVQLSCRSLQMQPATFTSPIPGVGQVTTYFTTYNPARTPRFDTRAGITYFSSELRPRAGQTGVFETDYLTVQANTITEYGSLTLNLSTADANGNNLPDILKVSRAASINLTGTARSDQPAGLSYAVSGTWTRQAGQTTGNYSITLSITAGGVGAVSFGGNLNIVATVPARSSATYVRSPNNVLTFTIAFPAANGAITTSTFSAPFTVTNANTISIPIFAFVDSNGDRYQVQAATLARSGRTYAGSLRLVDGQPQTSWADYLDWYIEITDNNDSDGDGIPNLSDSVDVVPTVVPPSIVAQPQGSSRAIGASATLSASISGADLSYQWFLNDTPILGANSSSYTLNNVQPWMAGAYKLRASNGGGSVTTTPVGVTVGSTLIMDAPKEPAPRLANISTRGFVGTDAEAIVIGFVTTGGSNQRLLIRAAGPALTRFGVSDALVDPQLTIYNSQGIVNSSNDDWRAEDALIAQSVGAFPFTFGSRDAAISGSFASGAYTIEVSGVGGGTGIGLIEAYDLDTSDEAVRLANISTRGKVAAGDALIAGLVVSGTTPRRILIRGIGPTLASFGLNTALPDPVLTVYDASGRKLFENDDWGTQENAVAIQTVAIKAGAFALQNNSRDATILAFVPPGGYTFVVTGKGSAEGIALIEAYDLDYEVPAQPATATGAVAHYAFDNNLNDGSGNGLNLSPGGAFSFVADRFGNPTSAVQLVTPASNGSFFLGTGPNLANQSSSVAFWIRKDYVGNGSNGTWVFGLGNPVGVGGSNGKDMHVALDYGSSIRYSFFFNDFDISTPLSAGTWYHLAFTYNNATGLRTIYVNGVSAATKTTAVPFSGGNSLKVGFPGITLDALIFYNRALTASEVSALAAR